MIIKNILETTILKLVVNNVDVSIFYTHSFLQTDSYEVNAKYEINLKQKNDKTLYSILIVAVTVL